MKSTAPARKSSKPSSPTSKIRYKKGQPILVGTVSIEKSEQLSAMLKQRGIPHQVLNARYHEQEAEIVAQAGVPAKVTIATNMAGRGTDIQLGGNLDMRVKAQLKGGETPEQIAALRKQIAVDIDEKKRRALAAGGLYVLGTERHESRRIDNQLRGRTGRQGDPGKSKFYICLEDDLLRIFAAERLDAIMRGLGIQEDEAIVHPWMNKALETSQRRVEQRNFEIRKNLLKFDDVINDQRKVVFEQRIEFMRTADVSGIVKDMRHEVAETAINRAMPEKAYAEQWDVPGLIESIEEVFGISPPIADWAHEEGIANAECFERLLKEIDRAFAAKSAALGPERMRWIEKQILLRCSTCAGANTFRISIICARYPFARLCAARSAERIQERGVRAVRTHVVRSAHHGHAPADAAADRSAAGRRTFAAARRIRWWKCTPIRAPAKTKWPARVSPSLRRRKRAQPLTPPAAAPVRTPPGFDQNDPATWGKISRNAPCPCGSGKKYKHCHGDVGMAA